ncbi:RNA polymerase III subunit C82 [Tulasnella sp. 418]|nr:RNA polymerase III subunit C82 [Tulasnella sp. 418]
MADIQTTRLCYHIIHSHFGPITAQVAGALLTRGRLPISQILRFTSLPPSKVRLSLLTLVQHNLVWHSENDVEGEVFEVNWEEGIARLRLGRYITFAKEVFGEEAEEIVSCILDHGKLRQKETLDYVCGPDPKKRKLYASTFHKLVESKHLKTSTALSHTSPRDRLIRYEEEGKQERRASTKGSILMPKDVMEVRIAAGIRMQREEEEAEATGMRKVTKEVRDGKTGKRKGTSEEEEVVNEDAYFKVNYAKFNIYLRNQIIAQAVERKYNVQAAEILRAILKCTEQKQHNLLDIRSEPVTSHLIAANLDPAVLLNTGLRVPKSRGSKASVPTIRDYLSLLASEDNPTANGVAGAFIAPLGASSGKYTVEFDIIGRRLKLRVFESVVRERFGEDAVKIVRILLDKGKMDEKHLAKVALMAHSAIRPILVRLSSASLVSLQEVPKSADRNPSRTFYLWYVDLAKAYSNLLSALYQTLANIVARDREEQEKVRPVLDKRDRSDVAGDERLLGRAEIAALREWEEKQMRLNVLAQRVEEAVFILRDMLGDPGTER